MSAWGQERTSQRVGVMSAFPPIADIRTRPALRSAKQLRQLGDIGSDEKIGPASGPPVLLRAAITSQVSLCRIVPAIVRGHADLSLAENSGVGDRETNLRSRLVGNFGECKL